MSDICLKDQTILVTGGAGFLGGSIVHKLRLRGCTQIVIPRKSDYDLSKEENVHRLFENNPITLVIHCASNHGGLAYNIEYGAEVYYHNILMNTYLMEYANRAKVSRFVSVGTVDAYPKSASKPLKEESFWDGYPEPTSAPYAFSKKMMHVQGNAYRKQFGLSAIHLLLMNLYGPGDEVRAWMCHVIPALLNRIYQAIKLNQNQLTVWGDGTQLREFIHVDDAAEGVVLAAEKYDSTEPLNLGTGQDIPISEVVRILTDITGFKGEIVYLPSQPSGVPKKQFDVSRAKNLIGFTASKDFVTGLRETVEWYRRTHVE